MWLMRLYENNISVTPAIPKFIELCHCGLQISIELLLIFPKKQLELLADASLDNDKPFS